MATANIYDLHRDGEYIGSFTGEEISSRLNMPIKSFRCAVLEGRTIRDHYKVIKVDKKIPKNSPLLLEFDMVTTDLLKKAGRI